MSEEMIQDVPIDPETTSAPAPAADTDDQQDMSVALGPCADSET